MYEIWIDGSSRGNPGVASIAVYAEHDGIEYYKASALLEGIKTNNEAEYESCIEALILASNLNEKCIIYTDSALVVGQLTKDWKCNFPHLITLRDIAKKLLKPNIELKQIGREYNKANKLAQSTSLKSKK